MKRNILIFAFSIAITNIYSQKVGIGTTSPERTLDINGNLKVEKTTDKTDNTEYRFLLAANKNNGDIDYITIPALDQNDNKNVEVAKNIYISNTPIDSKTCSCGELTFKIDSDNLTKFKLNSLKSFEAASVGETSAVTSITLGYGAKSWVSSDYAYKDITEKIITTNNFNVYRELDNVAFGTGNIGEIKIYTIVLPKQNNLYRLTLSRLINGVVNSVTNHQYGLMCEKFYVKEI